MELKPGLYIVATPIGNLDDITHRSINVLKHSDYIFCEDTRTTSRLLQKHLIDKKKLMIYNDHSGEQIRGKIESIIQSGMVVSLVSDAGTPTISDPGYKLIRSLQDSGYYVDFLPGPCALISGLVLSSIPSDKFYFGGFMPKALVAKKNMLESLKNLDATLIFYDVSGRIISSLELIKSILGNREVAIARELTKMFQEVIRGRVDELLLNQTNIKLKGEFVLIIAREGDVDCCQKFLSEEQIFDLLEDYKEKGLSSRDIASLIKEEHNIVMSKNEIYKMIDMLFER